MSRNPHLTADSTQNHIWLINGNCISATEITHRFQTARPSVRQSLLKYLLPWLHNMELVDPSLPATNPLTNFLTRLSDSQQADHFLPPLKGEGWGSTQATEMVLNNLFYITVKVSYCSLMTVTFVQICFLFIFDLHLPFIFFILLYLFLLLIYSHLSLRVLLFV